MRAPHVLFLSIALILAGALPALAAPNTSSGGQKCDESASNVKHDIGGKHYTCDKCVFSKCDSGGGSINNCQRVTEWTNCTEAAASGGGGGIGPARTTVDKMAPPKTPPKPGSQANPGTRQ